MKTVFIVDDNETNRMAAKTALDNKYSAFALPSAARMFHLLEKITPDLILLDVDMPEMNGYEAIKILKSKPETKNIPVIFLTARTDTGDEFEGLSLGAIDYITKPFQPLLLLKRIDVHLLAEVQKNELEKLTEDLKHFNDNLQVMVLEKTKNVLELKDALIKTMAELIEYRDSNTGGHIERTQRYIQLLINEIKKRGLYSEQTSTWDVNMLIQSCQLHDVGKISINDDILRKSEALDDDELDEMKKHSTYGEQLIKKIESMTRESDFLTHARIFAGSHHERWDGKGYPRGLCGEEIPLEGRIMAIADIYDMLVSERVNKNYYTHEQAVEIIKEDSGKHFDPNLVEVFLSVADDFREQSSL